MPAPAFAASEGVDAVVGDDVEAGLALHDVGHRQPSAHGVDDFGHTPKIADARGWTRWSGVARARGGYVGGVMVSDLRHYLDMPEGAPGPAKRLAAQPSATVRSGSARPVGTSATSAVGCTRRPGRRPCDGFVTVFRHANGEIAWGCDVCGDEGVITGWEGSPSDVSGLDDSDVDGDPIALVMPRELFDRIRRVLLLDAASELLVARAEGSSAGVILAGSSEAFDELAGYVASEANAETDRRRARLLDEACDLLEAALDGM